MLNVVTIVVSKMTSHCAGTVQMREESESGIRKWEETGFKTTAEECQCQKHGAVCREFESEARERREGAAVTCDGSLFHRRAAATRNALSPTLIEHGFRWWNTVAIVSLSYRGLTWSSNTSLHQ